MTNEPMFYYADAERNIYVPLEHVEAASKIINPLQKHLKDTHKARVWAFNQDSAYKLAASRLIGRGFMIFALTEENSHRVFDNKKRLGVHTDWTHVGR